MSTLRLFALLSLLAPSLASAHDAGPSKVPANAAAKSADSAAGPRGVLGQLSPTYRGIAIPAAPSSWKFSSTARAERTDKPSGVLTELAKHRAH